jgi:hypothetical protein
MFFVKFITEAKDFCVFFDESYKKTTLEEIQIKDKIKNDFCEKNKINLIRIKYDETVNEKLNSFFNI